MQDNSKHNVGLDLLDESAQSTAAHLPTMQEEPTMARKSKRIPSAKKAHVPVVKKEPVELVSKQKANFGDAKPARSEPAFMIDLSPVLRRAQTSFVNFDQKARPSNAVANPTRVIRPPAGNQP